MLQFLIPISLFCPLGALLPLQDGAPLVFHGRVWVVEDGVRRAAQGGSMHLNAEVRWDCRDEYDVRVEDGRFRQIVHPVHEQYSIGMVQIEGREALCRWQAPRAALADSVDLEARFLPMSRVRVRLRDSGEELGSCEMQADHLPAKPSSVELPALVSAWREDEFDAPWQMRRTLRARSLGTAWGSVVVDLEAGGDFWINLAPEARLRVSVFVPPEVPQQELRLVGCSDSLTSDWKSLTHDGQSLRFDGLSEGAYSIETRARRSDSSKAHQRAEFHLCENETRDLLLDLDGLAAVQRAHVRGSLTVDASWPTPATPVELSFFRKDPNTGRHALELRVEASADGTGALAWDAGRLRVGHYAVVVEPFGSASEFDVFAGPVQAALQVPPGFTHRLRFVDARTRRALDVDSLTWWPAELCNGPSANKRLSHATASGPDFVLEAPRGKLRVVPHLAGYRDAEFVLAPHRGDAQYEYALEPDCTIRVRLLDGGRAVQPPSSDVLRILLMKGAGVLPQRSLRDGAVQVRLEEPGTYAISSDCFAGFAASEAIVVEARLGEVVDVSLHVSPRGEVR